MRETRALDAPAGAHALRIPIGLEPCFFGASTGAAAALAAAARLGAHVRAVVSRGGRPDLAEMYLRRVSAPTLLIVGGADEVVLELNRRALDALGCERRLAIVRGATHLFPEPGALESVAALAGDWITQHLVALPAGPSPLGDVRLVEPVGAR